MTDDYLLVNRAIQAGERFGALAALFDPVTFRHLDVVGVQEGWRCWEVGAGGVTVPSWLVGRVGRSGSVLASDIDVRWLPPDAGFEVRCHDVVADDPPAGGFDLVHARLVLTHLPGRADALARMAAALRPGGWLVVEDFDVDFQPCATPDATTLEHYRANRIRAGFLALLTERGVDLELGRKLPRMLREVGLVEVAADAYAPLALSGAAALDRANLEQLRDALIGLGAATSEELDAHLEAADAGLVDIATPPLVSVWGRRRPSG